MPRRRIKNVASSPRENHCGVVMSRLMWFCSLGSTPAVASVSLFETDGPLESNVWKRPPRCPPSLAAFTYLQARESNPSLLDRFIQRKPTTDCLDTDHDNVNPPVHQVTFTRVDEPWRPG